MGIVEEAKKGKKDTRKTKISSNEVKLFKAWIKDEITSQQGSKALNISAPYLFVYRMGNVAKYLYKEGKINLK